jgi:Carboxypeptidase regulatory-like domain
MKVTNFVGGTMGKRILGVLVVVAGVFCAPTLLAQSGLATITGLVTDPTAAVLPGAKISIIQAATQERYDSVTNRAGIYEVSQLKPGTYSVEASAPNFKSIIHSNIVVQVNDRIGLDFKMEVGATDQTISVNSAQPQLHTEDAELGEVVTSSMIETLPAISGNNGRDPFALLFLAGNVQGGSAGGSQSPRAGWQLQDGGAITSGLPDLRINGGRPGALEYMVDGIPATGGFAHNVVNDTPTMEATQEFKVVTNGISAEYGRLSGGFLSVTTKAGTSQFHGQLFEYNQTSYLNANTWNNDALCATTPSTSASPNLACTKPNFRRNDFGVAGGGPVIIPHLYNGKSKTFWFANYEGIRQSTAGNPTIGQTITDQERSGDLTDIGTGVPSDPYATVWDPYGPISSTPQLNPDNGQLQYERLALAGGDGRHIPIGELDPVIQQYVALMPHPNHAPIPGSGTAGNFIVAQPEVIDSNVWAIRLDQVITDKQSIFGRYSHNTLTDSVAPFYPTLGTSSATKLNGGFGAEVHYTYTINPTMILELETGGNFSPYNTGTFLPTSIKSSTFGYGPAIQALVGSNDVVRISQGPFTEGTTFGCGACQYSQGFNGNTGALVNTTNFVYSGSLTKILNKHSLKFGYEGRRYYDNFTQDAQSNTSGGISDGYAFDAEGITQFIGDNGSGVWSPQGYNSGVGQFLLGIDSWVRVTNKLGRSLASNYYASYIQDDYKITPRLTLNLGFRWEMESPVTERHNNLTVWNPNVVAPFTIANGWTWAGALQNAGLDPSTVPTPYWVTNGFAPGSIQAVTSAQYPSRLSSKYHPWNFAPRLGFAFQADPKTVIRGSFAEMYLPTSGNLSTYGDTPGVYYTTTANNQSTQGPPGANTGIYPTFTPRTVASPWDPSQITTYTRNNLQINSQAAASGNGVGAPSIFMHMPYELDWSLGFQRQLPHQWLLELTYSANWSDTLITINNPSHFPKSYYTGGPTGPNPQLFTTSVQSPTAGQISDNSLTGLNQPLGVLEYLYPYYGPAIVEGVNTGLASYQSGNLRIQRNFSNGFQMLLNYTYGKAMDDTGGGDTYLGNPGQGAGSGGKSYQQVDGSVKSVYGLSPWDETHRVVVFYNYQIPVGAGRQFLSDTSTIGGKLLNAAIGGWELSGTTSWRSGRPVQMNVQGSNVDQGIYIRSTFGSVASGYTLSQLKNAHPHNVVAPANTGIPATSTPFFNINAIQGSPASNGNPAQPGIVQSFTYGDIPYEISLFRNPGFWDSDLSVMKNFSFNRDGSMYFQLRLESFNFLNHPGWGPYDTNTSDNTFGYVTGTANPSRTLQVGGRFVF